MAIYFPSRFVFVFSALKERTNERTNEPRAKNDSRHQEKKKSKKHIDVKMTTTQVRWAVALGKCDDETKERTREDWILQMVTSLVNA